jgi:hypothetical protein
MAKIRRQESEGWSERERSRFSKEAGDESQAPRPSPKDQRIRWSQGIVLRSNVRYEKETDKLKDSQ